MIPAGDILLDRATGRRVQDVSDPDEALALAERLRPALRRLRASLGEETDRDRRRALERKIGRFKRARRALIATTGGNEPRFAVAFLSAAKLKLEPSTFQAIAALARNMLNEKD